MTAHQDRSAATSADTFPQIFRVRQKFEAPMVNDVPGQVEAQLQRLDLGRAIAPGQTVALAAGSRGIHRIGEIIRTIVDHVKGLGAAPFIVPAMGSHAGGTAAGQRAILESLGITEVYCGCPVRASMETVIVCQAAEGFPVHFDRHAHGADHVIVCNRIKPHTQFVGQIESGLLKMLLIGLGKLDGATVYHRAIKDFSFAQILRSVTDQVLARCPITAGVAIVENSSGVTARVDAVRPEQFAESDRELLVLAREWAPRLPFDRADVLLIDEIGKNISGTGFDVSATGRRFLDHEPAPEEYPKIRIIGLRDLTELSGGNAEGMGLAEFCRTRLLEKVDRQVTRVNALTSGHYTGAMMPLDYESDGEMLGEMLREIGLTEPPDARLMWIRNTLSMTEVECSAAYLDEAHERQDLEILTPLRSLPVGVDGNLPDDFFDPTAA